MEVVTGPDFVHTQTLNRLVEQYQTDLLRMCYLYLHDAELARDAVQETYLKAYRALDSFRGECGEKTWLMKIAMNTCRDLRRLAWFRHIDRRVTPDMMPSAFVAFEEKDEEVLTAVMALPVKLRESVLLYFYQDMSVKEIAQALGVSRQTVISLEKGKYNPSLALAFKLARYFGLPIEAIFDDSDEYPGATSPQ